MPLQPTLLGRLKIILKMKGVRERLLLVFSHTFHSAVIFLAPNANSKSASLRRG
jgi:hypothetical protein